MYIKFSKTKKVKNPVRARNNDAGFDLFIPDEFYVKNELELKKCDEFILKPNCSVLIPSGLKIEIPHGYCALMCNKSGIATKKNLIVGAEVIDEGYEGEWHIDLHNIGQNDIILNSGDKIVQVLFIPVLSFDLLETKEEKLFQKSVLDRGTGGFGSTGDK